MRTNSLVTRSHLFAGPTCLGGCLCGPCTTFVFVQVFVILELRITPVCGHHATRECAVFVVLSLFLEVECVSGSPCEYECDCVWESVCASVFCGCVKELYSRTKFSFVACDLYATYSVRIGL